ncbi:MAG: hypothetical protein JW993_01060 [Sedimentisphaerales bacterium]|nr:hypothetical protein [Sedimentisphaerales bacterium]
MRRDGIVDDIRADGPALALVDRIQKRFEQGLGDSLAVVLESRIQSDGTLYPVEIAVLRQQGTRKLSERYRAHNFHNPAGAPATLYPLVRDDWPDLTVAQVLKIVDADALQRRVSFDGSRTATDLRQRRRQNWFDALLRWVLGPRVANSFNWSRMVRSEHETDGFMTLDGESLVSLIWPNLHLKIQSGSSQVKREIRLLPEDPNRPGLVGLQYVHFAETEDYWFDPAKGDMRVEYVKRQYGTAGVSRLLVTETAQMPSGQWYPQTIRMESARELRVLLDPNTPSGRDATSSSGADSLESGQPKP